MREIEEGTKCVVQERFYAMHSSEHDTRRELGVGRWFEVGELFVAGELIPAFRSHRQFVVSEKDGEVYSIDLPTMSRRDFRVVSPTKSGMTT